MKIDRRTCLKMFGIGTVYSPFALTALGSEKSDRKPNFIIIYCDDLGYGDIGCFGSKKHRTPNIDQMAKEGRRFTSWYVTSGVCTPSRSSLMTGCYPRRVNMHEDGKGGWVLFPVAKRGLNPSEITIPEVLKTQGYTTMCVGKWHLGDQPQFLPTRQGFDSYFGIPYSNDMQIERRGDPPLPLMRDETVIEAPADQTTLTKRYAEEAVAFIKKSKDKPFFLYMPHTMPHNPVNSSPAFKGKSANGGYGDSVEEIDWATGEVLKTLKKEGIDDNTFVIFSSDNGAAQRWGGSNLPLSGWKGSTMEGGMRVPCVMRWPGHIPADSSCDELVATLDILPTFAGLAQAEVPKDRIIDGKDIWSLMSGVAGAKTPHEAFYYYKIRQLQAVRSGKWKLHLEQIIKQKNGVVRTIPQRLFNLETDLQEKIDVSKKQPKVVARLIALAQIAQVDLGNNDTEGKGQRPAGRVELAKPLLLKK